eukprot:scaffold1085_cov407-Prasinococcus_capsulatus_cf.AAC.61
MTRGSREYDTRNTLPAARLAGRARPGAEWTVDRTPPRPFMRALASHPEAAARCAAARRLRRPSAAVAGAVETPPRGRNVQRFTACSPVPWFRTAWEDVACVHRRLSCECRCSHHSCNCRQQAPRHVRMTLSMHDTVESRCRVCHPLGLLCLGVA